MTRTGSISFTPRRLTRPLRLTLAVLVAGFLAALTSSSAMAATTVCHPGINGLGTPAPGSVVAPGLRVVSTQFSLGDCTTAFFVSARAADGTIWAVDYNNDIWKSTDDLRTLQETYTATGYAQVEQVLPLASGTILIVVRDASGNRHILRSTDSTGTAFSASVLDLPAGSSLLDSNSWTQIGNTIYIGQYSKPPVHLWRSTDDGRTFSVVFQDSSVDEIHSVMTDPYVAGRLWMMLMAPSRVRLKPPYSVTPTTAGRPGPGSASRYIRSLG